MTATYGLKYFSPAGVALATIDDFEYLECVLAEMQIGTLTVQVAPHLDPQLFQRDGRIAFYRSPPRELSTGTARLVGNCLWLVARRRQVMTKNGDVRTILTCVHPNALLARRVIAYDEGTAEASKSDFIDDMMKAIVRENFTAATDTDRNWSSAYFVVEGDASETSGALPWEGSYRNVLITLQELAAREAAATGGTYCGFEVYNQSEDGPFRFRTYTGQRGADRGNLSGEPLVLSTIHGSMNSQELDEDWRAIATAVYVSGEGVDDERLTTVGTDAELIAESPYGRIEWLYNATQSDASTFISGVALRVLREKRPRQLFTGDVTDTAYATFGEEYDWGDRVVGQAVKRAGGYLNPDRQFDCRVDPVKITVERREDEETGELLTTETLDIRLRSEA